MTFYEPIKLDFSNIKFISYEDHEKIKQRSQVNKYDLLFAMIGSIGNPVIVDTDREFSIKNVALFKYYSIDLSIPTYLNYYLITASQQMKKGAAGAVQSFVSLKILRQYIFPLPPLAEQTRIVAKVDQLMALCDELEAKKQKRNELRTQVNVAAMDKLLSAREPGAFNESWRRIAENFDLLYDTPETVGKLRQAILQLAVSGKLAPQNPADEPAAVLLERIRTEKERLIKQGKIKKSEPLPPVSPDEAPYALPDGWEWTRLSDLTELITKGSSPKWQGVNYADKSQGILFVTSENVGVYNLKLNKSKYVEPRFNEIEPRSILKKYDILMNIVGASIGRTALFTIDEIANINQAVCLIRILGDHKLSYIPYLLHFFNSPVCINYMLDKQVDNARANLSMTNIDGLVKSQNFEISSS